jgi:predicted AlkP superfamily pyrophosphatase or phosphodiesterase
MNYKNGLCLLTFSALTAVASAQSHPHVLMISIDGMRPDYVTHADEHHLKVPNLRRFMSEGSYAEGVVGVIPTITFPSHTTMITGVWPAQHGIFANAKFDPENIGPDEWYWKANENKAETLWQAAKQAGLSTASVSWPVTVDSPWIDWDISEYAQSENVGDKETKNTSHPLDLTAEMNAGIPAGVAPDGDDRKTAWAIGILNKYKPDFMTVHIGLTDHMQHEHGPFSTEANAAEEAADGLVGRIMQAELAIDPKATIIVVSDHGFVATNIHVNLSALLVQNGLIKLQPVPGKKQPKIASWDASVWETGGSAAIMLRDPNDKDTYNKVYEVLKKAQADPSLGIKRIVLHDEFVKGGGNPGAAFMVDFMPGFSVGRKYTGSLAIPAPNTGAHGYLPDQEPQVRSSFFAIGAHIDKHKNLGIVDMRQIAPTVANLLGASLPDAKQPILAIKR